MNALGLNALGLVVGLLGAPILMTLWTLWVSHRKFPWQVKCLAVTVVLVPLLLIKVPELILPLILQGWCVLLIMWWIRGKRSDGNPRIDRRISIANICSGTAMLAILMAISAQLPSLRTQSVMLTPSSSFQGPLEFGRLLCWGPLLALSTLAIVFLWRSRKRMLSIFVFLLLWGISFALTVWQNESLLEIVRLAHFLRVGLNTQLIGQQHVFAYTAIYLGIIAVWTACSVWALGLGRSPERTGDSPTLPAPPQRSWMGRLTRWAFAAPMLLSLVVLLLAFGVLYRGLLPLPPYQPRGAYDAGQANGLQELIAAARKLNPVLDSYPPVALGQQSQLQIDANKECFERFEQALAGENFAWYDWESNTNLLAQPNASHPFTLDGMNEMRSVARAFSFRGLQALSEDQHDKAAKDAMRIYELGAANHQDPCLIGLMVATAIEGISRDLAFAAIEGSSDESLAQMARQLHVMMERNPDAGVETNNAFAVEAFIIWNQGRLLDRVTHSAMIDPSVEDCIRIMLQRRNSHRRLLLAEIAIERFRRKHDRCPQDLNELVPGFLSKVPIDPFNASPSAPLSYRLAENEAGYVLYSFGRNQIDDQGKVSENGDPSEGDYNLRLFGGDLIAEHNAAVEEHEAEQKAIEAELEGEFDEEDLLFELPEMTE